MILKYLNIAWMLVLFFYSKGQSLDMYVNLAIENNQKINILKYRIEAQKQNNDIVKSFAEPNISTGVFLSPIQTRVGNQVGKIGVMQAFPWFGTQNAKKTIENDKTKMLELQLENEILFLKYKVSTSYYQLFKQDKLYELEGEYYELLKSLKKLATNMFENGKNSLADVFRIDVVINDSKTKQDLIKEEKKVVDKKFLFLLGNPENVKIESLDFLAINSPPLQNPLDSIFYHSKIKTEEIAQQRFQHEVELISKLSKPSFKVSVDYFFINENSQMNINENGQDAIMASLQFSLPIQTKKYRAMKSKMKAYKLGFEEKEKLRKFELETRLEEINFSIKKSHDEYMLNKKQIGILNKALKILTVDYSVSGNNLNDILEVHKQLIQYKKKMLMLVIQYYTAQGELNYVLNK